MKDDTLRPAFSRRQVLEWMKLGVYAIPAVGYVLFPAACGGNSLVAPLPDSFFPDGTFNYNISAARTGATGSCGIFGSSFSGTLRCVVAAGHVNITLTEAATRLYAGPIDSSGNFSCTGTNSFGTCTEGSGSTCSGLISTSSATCSEHLVVSGCCAGTVDYSCTGTCTSSGCH